MRTLTARQVGVAIVERDDDAKYVLREFPTINLYVADHHNEVKGPLMPIGGCHFAREFVKENYPDIVSIMLCEDPEDGLAQAFVDYGVISSILVKRQKMTWLTYSLRLYSFLDAKD